MDFNTPSGQALETLDCALQNSDKSRQWERSGVPDIFYQNTDDGTWEDIFNENHKNFMTAWYKTLAFISQHDLSIETLTEEWV